MSKIDKMLTILFYVTVTIYALEFIFVRGMFTTFLMGALMILVSCAVAVRAYMTKSYKSFILYVGTLAVVITEFVLIFSGVLY